MRVFLAIVNIEEWDMRTPTKSFGEKIVKDAFDALFYWSE